MRIYIEYQTKNFSKKLVIASKFINSKDFGILKNEITYIVFAKAK
jgi:hypothetical protein